MVVIFIFLSYKTGNSRKLKKSNKSYIKKLGSFFSSICGNLEKVKTKLPKLIGLQTIQF